MARSCQVKALTLSPAHHNIKTASVCFCLGGRDTIIYIFLIVDGPATQCTPPPVNHTFHRHINDPHYVAWPYGPALCVCARASMYACATASALSSWKQIAPETRPSSWSPPLESHCRGYSDRGNMAAELGGNRNGLFASASECHPRCPLLSG